MLSDFLLVLGTGVSSGFISGLAILKVRNGLQISLDNIHKAQEKQYDVIKNFETSRQYHVSSVHACQRVMEEELVDFEHTKRDLAQVMKFFTDVDVPVYENTPWMLALIDNLNRVFPDRVGPSQEFLTNNKMWNQRIKTGHTLTDEELSKWTAAFTDAKATSRNFKSPVYIKADSLTELEMSTIDE